MRLGMILAVVTILGAVAHAEPPIAPVEPEVPGVLLHDEDEPIEFACKLTSDYPRRWKHARGFSFTFGTMPTDGITLTGITLEYARRYGHKLVRAEYTYGVLMSEIGVVHSNGIMHRGELSVRVPLFGVGPRYDGGFKPGTFFVEGGIGHHWNRWRDGTTDSRMDATASFGMMLSGGGARTLLATSKVKVIVARADDGPDLICSTSGGTGCSPGGDGGYDFGIMATWGVSLGN